MGDILWMNKTVNIWNDHFWDKAQCCFEPNANTSQFDMLPCKYLQRPLGTIKADGDFNSPQVFSHKPNTWIHSDLMMALEEGFGKEPPCIILQEIKQEARSLKSSQDMLLKNKEQMKCWRDCLHSLPPEWAKVSASFSSFFTLYRR